MVATTSQAVPSTSTLLLNGKCLDSNKHGQAYIVGCNAGKYQKWKFENLGGRGTIVNEATGRCLDSNHAGAIYTLKCNGGSFQDWNAPKPGSSFLVKINNVATGRNLGLSSKAKLLASPGSKYSWSLGDLVINTGTHRIVGVANKCLGAARGSTTVGTAADLYGCNGAATQKWIFGGDQTVRAGGKCLEVKASTATGDDLPVRLNTCTGSADQKWTYKSSSDLVNPTRDKCLGLQGNSSDDYTVTQLSTCNGSSGQKWKLT
ncbi:MAG: glucosylceramidase [Actinomycetota bacterium]|nr:glucosylceramidase [Actinomycetota bacterium]